MQQLSVSSALIRTGMESVILKYIISKRTLSGINSGMKVHSRVDVESEYVYTITTAVVSIRDIDEALGLICEDNLGVYENFEYTKCLRDSSKFFISHKSRLLD